MDELTVSHFHVVQFTWKTLDTQRRLDVGLLDANVLWFPWGYKTSIMSRTEDRFLYIPNFV